MVALLRKLLFTLGHSYWFIPAAMATSAVALAVGVIGIDIHYRPSDLLPGFPDALLVSVDVARAILSTLATAMITVASVTFSLTLLAVSHATASIGSRVLPNFMGDRSKQITLGVFTSTFLYCLLVLRAVEAPSLGDAEGGFVPHFGVLVALLLAGAGAAVLIHFIHNVPQSIYIYKVVSDIAAELRQALGRLAARVEESRSHGRGKTAFPPGERFANAVVSERTGYVQRIDLDSLVCRAERNAARIRICCRAGEFCLPGKRLALVSGSAEDDEAFRDSIRDAFLIGRERTQDQDALFLVDELLQVAARALSPGVNDPYTANICVDHLMAVLGAAKPLAGDDWYLHDAGGEPRVALACPGFASITERVLDSLRPYLAGDVNAVCHCLAAIDGVLQTALEPDQREVLAAQALSLREAALERPLGRADRRRIEELITHRRPVAGSVDEDRRRQQSH